MDWPTVIAIIIVIVLIFIWLVHISYKNDLLNDTFREQYEDILNKGRYQYDKMFTSAPDLYKKNVGHQFDDNTKLILNKARKKEKMYKKNQYISKKNLKEAANNALLLGDIYRFNIAPNVDINKKRKAHRKADKYYRRALERINIDPQPKTELTPEFIVDRADAFYDEYVQDVIYNLGLPDIRRPDTKPLKNKILNARVKASVNKDRAKQHEKYYHNIKITSDSQNVHESEINHESKLKYQRIKEKNEREGGALPDMSVIITDFLNFGRGKSDLAHVQQVLHTMNNNGSITNLGDQECNVVRNVYKRIHSPENKDRYTTLKESLYDALANCMEKNYKGQYKEICAGGRCARVIGSLDLFDSDAKLAKPLKTAEILKEEIFNKAHMIIQHMVSKANKDVAQVYEGINTKPDAGLQARVDEFEASIKDEIERVIRQDYPDVKPGILDELIANAKAGV